jgi:nucleoside-diphosphate-sugar epimerase
MKRIFVTGGAGYVGAVAVPLLLENGYEVSVFDLMIYGEDVLEDHPNLTKIKGDIRDKGALKKHIRGHDVVIHLACISNDPSFELNPDLGKSINLDAFRPLVELSKESSVERFIYASSSSVYGVKEEENVHEDMLLEPLTDYSIFKAECENILLEYQDPNFTTVTIRPATVCGYSKRQRLDVVVNILTNLAYHNRKITVFGGNQLRPNIHIKDMALAYLNLIMAPKEKVEGQIFNTGDENYTVNELSQIVKNVIGEDVEMVVSDSDDNRSYHISSQKILDILGFEPTHSIEKAVLDLKAAFERGLLINPLENEKYFNIKTMQSINLI